MSTKTPCLKPVLARALAGFSLIELLMAAVIASSVAALLIGVLIAANRGASLRKDQAVATQLLASQLALLPDTLSLTAPLQGSCEGSYPDCRWRLEHEPTATPSLEKVVLTLEMQGRVFQASTYRRLTETQSP